MRVFLLLLLFGPKIACGNNLPLMDALVQQANADPFYFLSTCIFLGAILHTFLAGTFTKHAQTLTVQSGHSTYKSQVYHLLGEVEIIFALWLLPLVLCFTYYKGWGATIHYFETRQYTEPIFVVVIMTIAATRPILTLAESVLRSLVKYFGGETPATWWICILVFAPLLGSVITEPAAMTIAALLLAKQVLIHNAHTAFSYATLGLLFVNVSIGGVLTHFAAPPILMIATRWHWNSSFVFKHFGLEALLSILMSTLFYALIFHKQLRKMNKQAKTYVSSNKPQKKIPHGIILSHVLFLIWTVFNAHHIPFLIWGFLAFLVFTRITAVHQNPIALRNALLVGCFLAGLVTHGGLQEWWIEIILSRLGEQSLFFGALCLTAFNDNAAITYLASLVPDFENNFHLQYAVVSGAVAGGGLTVIANAPNPAGQSLLSKFFTNAIVKPLPLFLGALIPTLFTILSFRVLAHLLFPR
ncbi:MAG: putative Na+/H+ antiporter [Puniceicoccales bacterium]|jgi:Na+/H+ antiporter NhaD/arsenite permease-like protein|nr:putative Na+/H+ antiporter [Puniceicoccales bacterium]